MEISIFQDAVRTVIWTGGPWQDIQ